MIDHIYNYFSLRHKYNDNYDNDSNTDNYTDSIDAIEIKKKDTSFKSDDISEIIIENESNKIDDNKLMIDINHQINTARLNIENDIDILSKKDEEIIIILKSALRETFTNSKYMIQKIIKKNKFIGDDYYDISEQNKSLEELNQIYDEIIIKYK